MDNDCYTFEFSGFDDSGWIELIYNGVTVAGGQTPGNTIGGVTWFGIGGGCAAVDAKLDAITTPDYAQPGNIDISGRILNVGADDITSYDVVYSIGIDGGEESAVYSVSGVQIASGEEHSFTHDVPYEFADEASYQITVTIQNVNTDQDANTENNTLSKSILITTQQEQKVVVLEQFTTEMCPNCPPVLTILEQHLDENPNFIMMAHHSGYYTDWLTIPVSEDHLEFFNDGGSTYAPAGMVDRYYNGEDNDQDGTADPGPVFWDGSTYGTSYIDERTSQPAFLTVNVNGTNADGELSLQVSGEFLNDFTRDLGVSLWITEDHITAENQQGATGSWVHRFSVRGAISDRLGDPIETETTAQGTFNKNYTFTIDGTWNADELYLVAFVNNMSDDVNDREIHNAVQVKLSELVAAADTYAVNFTVT
ncbi:MAG: Omp28-related outer membrane protein, partial [Salinivirgaceae bacterium]|nr:Omp28-related outer membrane protein [Salinivirgaceae bacterium]